MLEQTSIFGRNINLVEHRDMDRLVSELAASPNYSVFFCNVHMLMLSQEDDALANAMDESDWIFADGVPVGWLQRKISNKDAKQIQGYEIMLAICERAVTLGENVGFIGSTQEVMRGLVGNLTEQFKGLSVPYQRCPPFMQGELVSTPAELQAINDSGIKWLFVGLGCPKQEKWIATYKNELDCHVLGIGAAFDWISGTTTQPPQWMQKHALAWLYRLVKNPFKMGPRYLKYNTKFILKLPRALFGRR